VDEHVKERTEREQEHARLVAEGHRLNRKARRAHPLYFRTRRAARQRRRFAEVVAAMNPVKDADA
jgi:hypothetical protein